MPGRKQRTNKALLFSAAALCLLCGGSFTSSSATSSPLNGIKMSDMFVAETTDPSVVVSDGTAAENTDASQAQTPVPEPAVTATATPTETPVPETISAEASPEAASGVWTPSGTNWCFMVNGAPLTGWLTDTDGRKYYFDANGLMQTGWLDDGGNRYYLNADGVMQTGDITISGQIYHFRTNGVLEGEGTTVQEASTETKLFSYINPNPVTPTPVPQETTAPAPEEAASTPAEVPQVTEEPAPSVTEAAPEATPVPEAAAPAETAAAETPESLGKVALTFDDGPSDFTDRLLDSLEANNAKATFFLVGKEIEYFSEPVKRMEQLGCEIGNHSYDHTDLSSLSAEEISSQIARTDQAILDLTGHGATVVRPPYGNINDTVRSTIATPMILWTIDPEDWVEGKATDEIVQTVMDQVTDGSIILMHDIFSSSVDAAEVLIPKLIEAGYELVTVHELAEANGITLSSGTAYGSLAKES